MTKYSLAVDIGASSGRMTLGSINEGRIQLKEIHRFKNSLIKKDNHYCWDIYALFKEIKYGISESVRQGYYPDSIGIDTWACDFVLLDEKDELITDAVSYRDPRTDGLIDEVTKYVTKENLYSRTGIQFQKFNTIYQLYSIKKSNPEILDKAKAFLMIPDYLNFLLSGVKVNEYTNATTTQLVNAHTKQWDTELIESLGLNRSMFQEINMPKTILGSLRKELVSEFGFDMKVILPATHDTGSAVVSIPESEDTVYISSGTWSLIGIEHDKPICDNKALQYNFTNEGGIDYRFRFLKNIMGLWMIQEVKRIYNEAFTFEEFVDLARKATNFHSIINVNEDRFLMPENMVQEIQKYCSENSQPIPTTPGEIAKCIYESLAICYKEATQEIEAIFDKKFNSISVIGGGSQNELLNQLIAKVTGKKIYAGPIEATTIGNIAVQFIALSTINNVHEARDLIRQSFEFKTYNQQKLQK